MIEGILGGVIILLLIFAFFSWRMAILHGKLSKLNQLVADMLDLGVSGDALDLATDFARREGYGS